MNVFPMTFDECPVCGSERRIIQEEAEHEIGAGRLPKGSTTGAMMTQTALFDPTAMSTGILAKREVPFLVGLYDVCAECGCFYLVEMRRDNRTISPQIKEMPKGNDGGTRWPTN